MVCLRWSLWHQKVVSPGVLLSCLWSLHYDRRLWVMLFLHEGYDTPYTKSKLNGRITTRRKTAVACVGYKYAHV
jgi:hypothetical protein